MKFRNLLTLLTLLAGPVFAEIPAEPAKSLDQTVVTAQAVTSVESSDVVERLKGRVNPNYVKALGSNKDHSQSPHGERPNG